MLGPAKGVSTVKPRIAKVSSWCHYGSSLDKCSLVRTISASCLNIMNSLTININHSHTNLVLYQIVMTSYVTFHKKHSRTDVVHYVIVMICY